MLSLSSSSRSKANTIFFYIAESSEEAFYFPVESQTAAVCELSYYGENDTFSHPAYEVQVRAAMGKAYCAKKINAAATVSERNYWICMKQIAK